MFVIACPLLVFNLLALKSMFLNIGCIKPYEKKRLHQLIAQTSCFGDYILTELGLPSRFPFSSFSRHVHCVGTDCNFQILSDTIPHFPRRPVRLVTFYFHHCATSYPVIIDTSSYCLSEFTSLICQTVCFQSKLFFESCTFLLTRLHVHITFMFNVTSCFTFIIQVKYCCVLYNSSRKSYHI